MSDRKPFDLDLSTARSNRRLRHEVAVPASIAGKSAAPIDCEIRDVSSTGMSLATQLQIPDAAGDPLAAGGEAHVAFSPDPEHTPTETVVLPVQIMWRRPLGVGIRFLNLDDDLRTVLQTMARKAVDARNDENIQGGAFSPADQRKILGACRKSLDKLLPNIIWAMRTDVSRRLRLFAAKAEGEAAVKALAEADLLDASASAIGRTIEIQFFRDFAKSADLDQTQELKFSDIAGHALPKSQNNLRVIGDRGAELSTVITTLAHAAEERYKSTLFELNVRLKDVIGHRMDNESNPLYPTAACRILWEATVQYCDSPRVRTELKAAITSRVVPLLGELYESLQKTLDDEHVPQAFDL